MEAVLRDHHGDSAALFHPYHSRGRLGVEALLDHLERCKLLFVAGRAGIGPKGLSISPTGLVFEDGGSRWMLQPWIGTFPRRWMAVPKPLSGGSSGSCWICETVKKLLPQRTASLSD